MLAGWSLGAGRKCNRGADKPGILLIRQHGLRSLPKSSASQCSGPHTLLTGSFEVFIM
jgi:hypothetical protein